MTEFFTKYKNIFLAIIIAVIVFFLYTRFFGNSENQSDSLLIAGSGGTTQEITIGKEFLSVLLELRSINLDESLFESKSFLILRDFSQEVEPQASGRPNPFREIGFDPIPPPSIPLDDDIDTIEEDDL
jgi:hypothetical protein